MIQNVIRDMGGIAAFGVISICLFFTVFIGAAIYALVQRKAFCDRMRALPLEDESHEQKGASDE
jgi:cbb3-type cytochrome oxidase subunit 3